MPSSFGESSSVPNAAAKSRPGAASGRGIPPVSANPFFEDLVIGETEELGSHAFTPEDIVGRLGSSIRSASMWMRRPRRAAVRGACASGWHTARDLDGQRMVGYRDRTRTDALPQERSPARPHPAFPI